MATCVLKHPYTKRIKNVYTYTSINSTTETLKIVMCLSSHY